MDAQIKEEKINYLLILISQLFAALSLLGKQNSEKKVKSVNLL